MSPKPAAAPVFDPSAAAKPGSGIYGLPCTRQESRVVVIPVPFDATTSYRPGTAAGPAAVLDASMQVDLYDRRFGRIYEKGIFMEPIPAKIRALSRKAAALARPLIAKGGADPSKKADLARLKGIDAASEEMNRYVESRAAAALADGKVPLVLGGEHSVPFGNIKVCAERYPNLGILHLDAHMDLRDAFEGFAWSHASIMRNVLGRIPGVATLVQVGIRDFGEDELEFARSQGPRCVVHFDDQLAERALEGTPWSAQCVHILQPLPRQVYLSVDIDVLEPALCPHTGTPVPGGLSFQRAVLLLEALRNSGRSVVGMDLVEVAPGTPKEPPIDANTGARVLYKMCGLA